MKKLIALSFLLLLFNCKTDVLNFATVSGQINNPHKSKILTIFNDDNSFKKTITLNKNGAFKDTLVVEPGIYHFKHGNQYGMVHLENNSTVKIETDYNDFDNALVFKGDAADFNNLHIKTYLTADLFFTDELEQNATDVTLAVACDSFLKAYETLKDTYTNINEKQLKILDGNVKNIANQYKSYITSKIAIRKDFPKGSESPSFKNYQNINGENINLKDFKGKYVFIDVWATWCVPCIIEIPHLKKIEQQFKDKNIAFVSISVDDGRAYKGDIDAAKKAWKTMVKDKALTGVQLIADNSFKSEFIKAYKINSIPRFILIDPNGNIVTADAPRPSSDALLKLLNGLSDL